MSNSVDKAKNIKSTASSMIKGEIALVKAPNIDPTGIGALINEIGAVDWAVKYSYVVYIDGLDSPFKKGYVPVFNIIRGVKGITVNNIKLPFYGEFPVPAGRSLNTLSVYMYDNADLVVYNSLMEWIESIGNGSTLGYLDDITREVVVMNLSPNETVGVESPVNIESYTVYPIGVIPIQNSSDSTLMELQVDFAVVEQKRVAYSNK
jgi:hypothetical protein